MISIDINFNATIEKTQKQTNFEKLRIIGKFDVICLMRD